MLFLVLSFDTQRKGKVMLPKMSRIAVLLAVVGLSLLTTPAKAGGEGMQLTYRAVVQGGPNGLQRLKLFHEQLKQLLGVTDLAMAEVGCDRCAELDSGEPETSLNFYMPRNTLVVLAFALSWSHVQATNGHDLFKISLDAVKPPDPICPAVAGCKPRAACEVTQFCDKPWGGTCDKC